MDRSSTLDAVRTLVLFYSYEYIYSYSKIGYF